MAILTKAQLEALNQSSFPDQSTEAITPAILRNYNTQTIDTLVDSLDTGSFTTDAEFNAFTSSTNSSITQLNASSASQQISINALNGATASYATSAITASSLITASVNLNTITFTKGNGTTFAVTVDTGSGGGGSVPAGTISSSAQIVGLGFLQTSSFNAYTASTDSSITQLNASSASQQISINALNTNSGSVNSSITQLNASSASQQISINALNTTSSSLNTSASLALTTASFSGNTLTFTKGNGTTFGVVLPDVSGSTIPIGTISGSSQITALGFVSSSVTASSLITASVNLNTITFTKGDASTFAITVDTGSGGGGSVPAGTVSSSAQVLDYNIFATTGSNTFTEKQIINGTENGLAITGSSGYIDLSGYNAHISMYTGTGSIRFYSGSALGNGASDLGTWVNMQTNPSNGALAISSFPANDHFVDFDIAASASVFTQPIQLSDTRTGINLLTLLNKSGSVVFVGPGWSRVMTHISSSNNVPLNLIFKTNNNTADTIISGSNNIFANPVAPVAGFKRYTTTGNLALQGALPQISGAMEFSPNISGNTLASTGNPLIIRGPVSSSAYSIQNNAIFGGAVNLGTSATLTYERAINGTTINNNIVNGTINVTAYKTAFISSSAITIQGSNIGGTVNLNADSSSITLAGSTIQNGVLTVNNSYYNAAATGSNNVLQIAQGNAIFGNSTLLYASGSNTTTGTARQFNSNIVAGTFNSASLNLNGDNSNIFATAIIGHNLIVTGSSALTPAAAIRSNTYGSAFFGRFNAEDGNRAKTAETVFAIGTGNTTTPKTGFLIDSGSNTFIEGTLNVSGSTTITGSLSVTNLIVSGSTQFNVGAFNSTITQSGSSAVSQSMTFNNTDITQGVSVVDTTKLTIANSGTYNIQFSAQLLADTGADTVWIWLKQNGTNVSNTATKLVLRNNEADVAAWNFVVPATANDYFELVWQNNGGHTKLLYEVASGNYPAIPSVIATVTQVR